MIPVLHVLDKTEIIKILPKLAKPDVRDEVFGTLGGSVGKLFAPLPKQETSDDGITNTTSGVAEEKADNEYIIPPHTLLLEMNKLSVNKNNSEALIVCLHSSVYSPDVLGVVFNLLLKESKLPAFSFQVN